jgi:O-antigen/teichoic acid export membrane protein
MKVNTNSKQTYKNLSFNLMAYVVQFILNFSIPPLIIGKVGVSGYGFIGLANEFVSYLSILVSIFNSASSRFIAIAIYKENYTKANSYFNSLIITNSLIAGLVGILGALFIFNLNRFLSIPNSLLHDVKITFAVISLSYIITLVTMVFTTSVFVANKTDIQGVRNIIQHLVRFTLIIILLNVVSVRIYWIAFATLIANIIVAIMNISLTRKLTPELKIDIKKSNLGDVFTLAKSGALMALTLLSYILLSGLDLTIANTMLGEYKMGLLSISRIIPNNITGIISTIAPVFTPIFIALYAKNDRDELINNIKKSINTMAVIFFVPATGFLVFSNDFYSLWQDSLMADDLFLISILSGITVLQVYFNSTTSTLAQLAVVTNKLRIVGIINLVCGVVSIAFELLLIKYADIGLYAIVVPTSSVLILKYVFFDIIYAAHCIKVPKRFFLSSALKTWLSIPLLIIIMCIIKAFIPVNSWYILLIDCAICGIIGYSLMFLMYDKERLKFLIHKVNKFLNLIQ